MYGKGNIFLPVVHFFDRVKLKQGAVGIVFNKYRCDIKLVQKLYDIEDWHPPVNCDKV